MRSCAPGCSAPPATGSTATTHEQPLTRFVETEREFLRPLPSRPPELAVWARVKLHPDCHVQFEKTYYSASFRLVRQRLWLRATETTVQLFRDLELVATHLRQFRAGSRSTHRRAPAARGESPTSCATPSGVCVRAKTSVRPVTPSSSGCSLTASSTTCGPHKA